MSIFKSTLKPFVAAQLKAREKIVAQVGDDGKVGSAKFRGSDFLQYTNVNNGWVRMVSMVDYTSQKFNKETGKFEDDLTKYSGNQLSKKYVLEGGTLYNGRLRKGVNQVDGVYGSNIDKISGDPKSNTLDRTFGLRPMPGITSVSVNNKSAYGSLREATINFYAWDKHQLEELEILFMRPGYTVYLEWGWSAYLDHSISVKTVNSYPDNIKMKNFDILSPDVFGDNIPESSYYTFIDEKTEKARGNYDAMLGHVKNFSWQLMSNGGFQCSTTLISRGEVMEGIKASSNPGILLGSPTQPTNEVATEEPKETEQLSSFEKIFIALKGIINSSELNYPGTPPPKDANGVTIEGGTQQKSELYSEKPEQLKTIIGEYYASIKQGLEEDTFLTKYYDKGDILSGKGINVPDPIGGVLPTDGTADGSGIEYLNLNILIAILQRFFIAKNETTNEPAVYLVIPYETPCLMSEDSVSINPMTCLIKNQFASFITGTPDGFNPQIYNGFSYTGSKFIAGEPRAMGTFSNELAIQKPKTFTNEKKETFDVTRVNVGELGNIYVSIGKILEIYRGLAGSENGVDITEFL